MERLVQKGLAGQIIKGNIKYFEAASPRLLLGILEEERKLLDSKAKGIDFILPELMLAHGSKEKESVIIYRGVKGIKIIMEDILKTQETNHVLGAHKPPGQIKNYLANFHKRRIRLGIKDKLIFEKGDAERAMALAKMPYTEVKVLPRDNGGKTAINIYGSKVAILMWSEPIGILIENKDVADIFRMYFSIIWKTLA
jgi:hypothetical protein